MTFPFLTSYDPPGTSEGTLDPLGLYQIADQLAVQLVPAVRERMQRRRQQFDGAAILNAAAKGGISVPPSQLLPFFLAARSSVSAGQDLLGEALCSSYEAFRLTRQQGDANKDSEDDPIPPTVTLSHADWYLREFDHALQTPRDDARLITH